MRPRASSRDGDRPGVALLRSGLRGIGAVTLGVVLLSAVAAVISAVVALLT